MEHKVLVTDIARFCVNDGPGFRTNVYLKGCPLHCSWCHNPETIDPGPEIYWKRRLCTQCGKCLDACPKDAINPPVDPSLTRSEEYACHKIIRSRCESCMKCVEVCPSGALQVVGQPMGISEILDEVERDRPFYDNSGGGMTLSGGEPTLHARFAEDLLGQARSRSIHTCLDTNGHCAWEDLERIARKADIILFDLKHLDSRKHREQTGVNNATILENLERLSSMSMEIWVRIPVIPGFNDALDYHRHVADYLAGLPGAIDRIDLLAYHNWCQDKYDWLGRDWVYRDVEALDPTLLEVHVRIYRKHGFRATIGGSGFEDMERMSSL